MVMAIDGTKQFIQHQLQGAFARHLHVQPISHEVEEEGVMQVRGVGKHKIQRAFKYAHILSKDKKPLREHANEAFEARVALVALAPNHVAHLCSQMEVRPLDPASIAAEGVPQTRTEIHSKNTPRGMNKNRR